MGYSMSENDTNQPPEVTPVRVIMATFPNSESARQIGTILVEKQLVACINIIPEIESIYRWEGKVNQDREVLGIMKTTEEKLCDLKEIFNREHPYDVPELLVFNPVDGLEDYLKWVMEG